MVSVNFNSISRIIIFYPNLRKFIIFPASSFRRIYVIFDYLRGFEAF